MIDNEFIMGLLIQKPLSLRIFAFGKLSGQCVSSMNWCCGCLCSFISSLHSRVYKLASQCSCIISLSAGVADGNNSEGLSCIKMGKKTQQLWGCK